MEFYNYRIDLQNKTQQKLFHSMSYTGYSSHDHNISQTEQYQMENSITADLIYDQQNPLNLTYQESSKVLHFDALVDITNKIKISQALNIQNKSAPLQLFKNVQYPKIHIRTQYDENSTQQFYENQNLPIQEPKKTRAASLIYFQQKPLKVLNKNQTKKINKQNQLPRKVYQIDLPLQRPQIPGQSILKNRSKSNISISPGKYFPKNQPNQNLSNKQQVLLTSRSGYVLSISQAFLQNLTKQYNNPSFCEQQISLKQKIKRKISQDKKNQSRRLKTQTEQRHKNVHKKSCSKLYKPLQQNQAISSRTILSTQSFHFRQNKTLQNKKNTVKNLKQQKDQSQLKQCTFKPKINNFNKFKRL